MWLRGWIIDAGILRGCLDLWILGTQTTWYMTMEKVLLNIRDQSFTLHEWWHQSD